MLDSMYQEGTDQVLDDRVARPLQAPTVRPSFGANLWNTTKAPFAGVGAGANESAGMFSDILGAYGAVQAGIGLQADPSLLFDSEAQARRKQEGQQSRDAIQSGEAFSTDLGTGFRAKARSFMPDPATSNVVEDVLFGLSRFGSKAVVYTAAGGPALGPVLTAVDEGMNEADKLKAQGVDFATRTKVGAVAGVAAGAAVALPVAGKTIAETAALVAVGGPGAFVGQQAASKAILENAGYDKIAEQYDPFDPVGLAVATLVPAAFGAHAMRAKAKAKPVIDPEAVDAARVDQVQQQIVESNPYHPADVAGANDHVAAVERAHDQMAAGEPVNVTDIVSAERIDGARGQEFVNRVQTAIDDSAVIPDFVTNPAKTSMDRANRMMSDLLADPDIPAPIKTRLQEASLNGLMKPENKAYVAAVNTARKEGNLDTANIDRIHQSMVKHDKVATMATNDVVGNSQGGRSADDTTSGVRAARQILAAIEQDDGFTDYALRVIPGEFKGEINAGDILPVSKRWIDGNESNESLEGTSAAHIRNRDEKSIHEALRNLGALGKNGPNGFYFGDRIVLIKGQRIGSGEDVGESIIKDAEVVGIWKKPSNGLSEIQPNESSAPNSSGASPSATAPAIPPDQATATPSAKGEGKAAPSPFEAQTAELARTSPDMMVQLEGMDKPVRLADALEAVKKEAANDIQDANLLQVAADCFLRSA